LPFLCGLWGDLAQNFTGSLFPHYPSSANVCPNPSCFRGDISENVFQTHYNIGVKHAVAGFSTTKINRGGSGTSQMGAKGGTIPAGGAGGQNMQLN